ERVADVDGVGPRLVGCDSAQRKLRVRRAIEVRAVELPLITERRRAGRAHAESDALAFGHRLARRLRGDDGRSVTNAAGQIAKRSADREIIHRQRPYPVPGAQRLTESK